jgi:creatinine amidohydrolase
MVLKSHWWWDLTTQDFANFDAERVVAILPVGAVEQHGPHSPSVSMQRSMQVLSRARSN